MLYILETLGNVYHFLTLILLTSKHAKLPKRSKFLVGIWVSGYICFRHSNAMAPPPGISFFEKPDFGNTDFKIL